MGERASTEVGSVVNIAGFGTLAVHDLLVDELVDFEQVGADLGVLFQFLQNAADKTTSRLHFLDFTRGFQFDHEALSTLLRLVLNSSPARGQLPAPGTAKRRQRVRPRKSARASMEPARTLWLDDLVSTFWACRK